MGYTSPTGKIYLIKNVPFTSEYNHTIRFANLEAQQTYMLSKVDTTIDDTTYIKDNRAGSIRIKTQEESIRDCTYMMWKNSTIGETPAPDKHTYFYAFIDKVVYTSNSVAEIFYTLDVIQTYMFSWTLKKCLVERTHTESDNIGEHLEPEPVGFSGYKLTKLSSLIVDTDLRWVVYAPFDATHPPKIEELVINTATGQPDFTIKTMGDRGGIVQGLVGTVFTSSSEMFSALDGLDDRIASKIQAIVGMPAGFISPTSGTLTAVQSNIKTESSAGRPSTLNGYTPKNNKLLTYPYHTMLFTATTGGQHTLRWENFASPTNISFTLCLGISPQPELVCMPNNYGNGYTDGNKADTPYKLAISSFPHTAWVGDSFASYMATGGVTGLLSAGGALASGNLGGAFSSLAGTAITASNASFTADTVHGATGGATALSAMKKLNFYTYAQSITANDARRIDDFFTCYGYAINRLQVPKLTNGRLNQHYIKTANCCVTGTIPSGSIAEIERIFNKGITFWNGDTVGDYS